MTEVELPTDTLIVRVRSWDRPNRAIVSHPAANRSARRVLEVEGPAATATAIERAVPGTAVG